MSSDAALRMLEALVEAYDSKFGSGRYRLAYIFDHQHIYIYEFFRSRLYCVSTWTQDDLRSGSLAQIVLNGASAEYPMAVKF